MYHTSSVKTPVNKATVDTAYKLESSELSLYAFKTVSRTIFETLWGKLKNLLGMKLKTGVLYCFFHSAQKMKFSFKDFFSKCDQFRCFLRIWSNLLKKSLMENFIFCPVSAVDDIFICFHVTGIDYEINWINEHLLY